jgi:bifunctional DNase/RNase
MVMTQRALAMTLALLAGLAVAPSGCRRDPADDVEMTVRHVAFDPTAGAPVVVLEASDGVRVLPIWIGTAEAEAIARELQHVRPPRPLTHDLLLDVIESSGATLERVRITELRDDTFLAVLVLRNGGREIEVDGRPSDAIALALRAECPIVVNRRLLDRVPTAPGPGGRREARARDGPAG